jgi:large subunit ribosomal protein L9
MEIILKTDVKGLGKMLDIVNVKPGYARNYQVPQRLAVRATAKAKEEIEKNREAMEALFRKELAAAGDIAAQLAEASINLVRRVVEGERLYGSVSASDISDALKKQGFKIEKRQIDLPEPIKQLGVYSVPVNVFADVQGTVKVWVVKDEA